MYDFDPVGLKLLLVTETTQRLIYHGFEAKLISVNYSLILLYLYLIVEMDFDVWYIYVYFYECFSILYLDILYLW